MTGHTAPLHCPYCAGEDLHPVQEPSSAWRCAECLRIFVVTFVGLAPRPVGTGGSR